MPIVTLFYIFHQYSVNAVPPLLEDLCPHTKYLIKIKLGFQKFLIIYRYIYIYIYICSTDWAQGCIWPYMRVCGAYMHIVSLANIYIWPIYMFAMFVCMHLCLLLATCVPMGANWCKCMLRCTSVLLQGPWALAHCGLLPRVPQPHALQAKLPSRTFGGSATNT